MTTVIYITSLEEASGKSLISLGAMEAAAARVSKVGYFRPVVASDSESDPVIDLDFCSIGIRIHIEKDGQ